MGISSSFAHLGKFWQEKINNIIFRWTVSFIIIQISYLVYTLNALPPKIPLYYSLPWGESRLASFTSLFLLPLYSIIILFINSFLAMIYSKKIKVISQLLMLFSLIFTIFATIALFKSVGLVV